MKTIKKGRKQKGWAKEYNCTGKGNKDGGCGALLLIEEGDLFQTYASYMGRDEEWFVTFKCENCGVKTDIEDSPFRARDLPNFKEWEKTRPMLCHGVCNSCDGHHCPEERCHEIKCKCGPNDNE